MVWACLNKTGQMDPVSSVTTKLDCSCCLLRKVHRATQRLKVAAAAAAAVAAAILGAAAAAVAAAAGAARTQAGCTRGSVCSRRGRATAAPAVKTGRCSEMTGPPFCYRLYSINKLHVFRLSATKKRTRGRTARQYFYALSRENAQSATSCGDRS